MHVYITNPLCCPVVIGKTDGDKKEREDRLMRIRGTRHKV